VTEIRSEKTAWYDLPGKLSNTQAGVKSTETVRINFETGEIIEKSYTTGTTDFGLFETDSRSDEFIPKVTKTADTNTLKMTGETGSWGFPVANINYDFTITYDKSMRTITVGRTHDGFPSYQLWIGGTVRYDYQQGHIGELFGTRDVGGDR